MAGCAVWTRKFLGGLLLIFLLGCGIVAWRERTSLLSWFYIRNLARASDTNRPRWVGRVANLGEAALPGLFDCLTQPDGHVCANVCAALEYMTHTWGHGDARTAELALRLRASSRVSVRRGRSKSSIWPPAGLASLGARRTTCCPPLGIS